MSDKDLITLITQVSCRVQIDSDLCVAIAQQETNLDALKTRYEPGWSYFVTPSYFASRLGISIDTERVLQAISWGPLQVMGSVCRELSYTGQLTLLIQPELGVLFGCRKLKRLSLIYSSEKDLISAYNAGTPRKNSSGVYENASYVQNVVNRLTQIRSGGSLHG